MCFSALKMDKGKSYCMPVNDMYLHDICLTDSHTKADVNKMSTTEEIQNIFGIHTSENS